MTRHRWMLALALGCVALGVVTVGDAAPARNDIAPAEPAAVARAATREQEARVEIGPAVLRIYDEAGRVIYEE